MFKNYFKIAWRNLLRYRAFSIINILGLSIGIASCLVLFIVIRYELSFDKFQPDYARIYHVVTEENTPDGKFYTPGIPFPAREALRLDFPEITSGALCANYGSQVTVEDPSGSTGNKKFIEETGFFFADPQFFKVFHYDWLLGTPEVLSEPNTTVLTQKNAEKYFGEWNQAEGKYLKLDNKVTVKVAGIIKDPPLNTDYPLGVITSFITLKSNPDTYFYSENWGATTSNFQMFMLLPENLSAEKVNQELVTFSKKNYPKKSGNERLHFLQPLREEHFDRRFESFGSHITEKSTLWTLGIIGLFIIIMACINFINLSTAQAVGRSKEIGIRKVLGSNRKELLKQLLGETSILVGIAIILGVAIAWLCLPFIKHIASIEETLYLLNGVTGLFILLLFIVICFLAGLYPALILSGFKPVLALKNKITSATVGGISVRRGLVISQFAISQVLIIGTIIAVSQMNFIKNADLGFNKETVLVFNSNNDSIAFTRQSFFKQKLLQIPGVRAVAFSSDVPSSENNSATNFGFDHRPEPDFNVYTKFADEDYFKTFDIQFLYGREFKKSDTINEVVVNETLVKKLGVSSPEEMVGKDIRFGTSAWKKVVGVVRDFKTNSLKEDIKPLAIAPFRNFYNVTSIKFNSANLSKTRSDVEKMWDEIYPEYAFSSNFLDKQIDQFYDQDQKLSFLYKIFAGMAIFISCLGLYGLVSFMAVQKTKEIGIRKVLGASIQNIIYLFSKEFTILILIGFTVAIPVAWYMMNSWLQNFVYRMKISPVIFITALFISLVLAWLAVGYKSIKAALANPVKSLRSE